MRCEREIVRPHDPQHSLGVHHLRALAVPQPVHLRRRPPVAVAWTGIDDRANDRQQGSVLGLAVETACGLDRLAAGGQVGAGHAQRLGHRLHREPPA